MNRTTCNTDGYANYYLLFSNCRETGMLRLFPSLRKSLRIDLRAFENESRGYPFEIWDRRAPSWPDTAGAQICSHLRFL